MEASGLQDAHRFSLEIVGQMSPNWSCGGNTISHHRMRCSVLDVRCKGHLPVGGVNMSGSDADGQASVGSHSTSASSLQPGDPLTYEFDATVFAQVR